jgi:hypothetical protein
MLLMGFLNLSGTVKPAGWTNIGSIQAPGFTNTIMAYWAKGDVASLNFTSSAGSAVGAICVAFSGCDLTYPIDTFGVWLGSSTSITAPSINAIANADILLGFMSSQSAAFGAIGGGYTDRAELSNPTPGIRIAASTLDTVAAGPTGDQTRTATNFVGKVGMTIALRQQVILQDTGWYPVEAQTNPLTVSVW